MYLYLSTHYINIVTQRVYKAIYVYYVLCIAVFDYICSTVFSGRLCY